VDVIEIYSYIVNEHFSEFYQDVLLQFKLVDVRSAMTFALKRLENLGLISCSIQHTKLYKITIAGYDFKPHLVFACGPLKQFLQNAYEMRGGVRKWVGKENEQPDGEKNAQEREEEESEEEDCGDGNDLDKEEISENEKVENYEMEEDDDDDNDGFEREQNENDNEGEEGDSSIHDEICYAPVRRKVGRPKLPGPPAISSDRRSRSSSGRQSTMLEQALGTKVTVPQKKQKKDIQWLTASDESYAQHNDEMLDEFLCGCSESSEYFPKRNPESHSRFVAHVPQMSDCSVGLRHLRDSAEEQSLKASLSGTAAEGEDVGDSHGNLESHGTDDFEEGVTARTSRSEENRARSAVDSWKDAEYSGMDVEEITDSTPPLLRAIRSPEDEAALSTLLKQCHAVVCLPGSVIQVRPMGTPLVYVCVLGALTKAVPPIDGVQADCCEDESEGRVKVEEEANRRLGSEEEQGQQNTPGLQLHSSCKTSMEATMAARDSNVMEDLEGDKEVLIGGVIACHPSQNERDRILEDTVAQHHITDITLHSPIIDDYVTAFDGSKNVKVLFSDCRPLLGEDGILSVLREHSCTTVEDATPHLVKAATALIEKQWDVTDVKEYVRLFKRFDGEINIMYKKSQLRHRRSMREIIDFHEYFKPLLESRHSMKMERLFTGEQSTMHDPATVETLPRGHRATSSSSKADVTATATADSLAKAKRKYIWQKPRPSPLSTPLQLREAVTALIADYTEGGGKYYLLPRLMPLLMKAGWVKAKATHNLSKLGFIVAPWVAKPIEEGGVMSGQKIDVRGSRAGPNPPVLDRDYFYETKRLIVYLTRSARVPLDQMYVDFSSDSADLLIEEASALERDVDCVAGWESVKTPRNSLLMAVRDTRGDDVADDEGVEGDGGNDGDPLDDYDDGGNDIDKINVDGDIDGNSTDVIDSDNDRDDDDDDDDDDGYYRQPVHSSSNSSVSGGNSSSSSRSSSRSSSSSSSSSRKLDPPVVCLDEDDDEDQGVSASEGRYRGGISGDQGDVCAVEFAGSGSDGNYPAVEHPATVLNAPRTQWGSESAKGIDSGGQLDARTSSDSAVNQIAKLSDELLTRIDSMICDARSSADDDSAEASSKGYVPRRKGPRKSSLASTSKLIPISSDPADTASTDEQNHDSDQSSIKSNGHFEPTDINSIPTDISISCADPPVQEEQGKYCGSRSPRDLRAAEVSTVPPRVSTSSRSRSDNSVLKVFTRPQQRPLTASQKKDITKLTIPEFPRHTRIPFLKHVNAKAIFWDHYFFMKKSKPVAQMNLDTCKYSAGYSVVCSEHSSSRNTDIGAFTNVSLARHKFTGSETPAA
jgi:hypothetical protein